MQLHQKRVIDEKAQLDIKAELLGKFIGESPIFAAMSNDEQELLKEQLEVMGHYSEILGDRIALFSTGE